MFIPGRSFLDVQLHIFTFSPLVALEATAFSFEDWQLLSRNVETERREQKNTAT
jgi:hypothetical protein